MLRSLTSTASRLARQRSFATATGDSLREPVKRACTALLDAEWVDADESIYELTEKAESLISQYRDVYNQQGAVQDALYDDVRQLHVLKEAAKITDAYSEFVEVIIRDHEDMLGTFGDNPEIPENGAKQALQILDDYGRLVAAIEDKHISRKLQDELGRKMVLVKMLLSVDNFSAVVYPVAGDRLVTSTK
ncbi:hypothetical protein BWQ96_03593 [Gracilariopsis chorda]|uniref:Uncharacterized protein n=1 Tax=Gracilariopsis chorda TaxID=448386 RepID=A0A2V3IWS3_9FLOR|nr:hypothetical protein BWQ96_03593 [Gracilariopsis chorda]|eukprot:PXF46604.1 hypothetical protein BWQ96_03593 [Gracilariopsis chorda]